MNTLIVSQQHATAEPIDLAESVAGEEDPGASIDAAMAAVKSDPPASRIGDEPFAADKPMRPGDQAPEGAPGHRRRCMPALRR